MNILKVKIEHVPFFRIFIFYGLGIISAFVMPWNELIYNCLQCILLIGLLLCLVLFYFRRLRKFQIILFLMLYLFGLFNLGRFMPRDIADTKHSNLYVAKLSEQARRTGQVLQCQAQVYVAMENNAGAYQELHLKLTIWDKDSLVKDLKKGTFIQFKGKIQELPAAFNPSQFDYSAYLRKKGIFYQAFIPQHEMRVIPEKDQNEDWFADWILRIQQALQEKFQRYIPDETAFQIASALTFGYRSSLSDEVFEVFSNTGTIHILSVSGFHVSLMYLLLTIALSPLDRVKHGKSIRLLSIFAFIWFYALICGFVPAVLRATVMFSLFLVGYWRNRVVLSFNTLFSSAFLLLLFDPFMLFDIGFQLSYLAVLGILVFVPIFQRAYSSKKKVIKSILNLVYVSIAAQIMTTPLAIFYFNQFPTYFLLSNLLITIPSTIILYLGSLLLIMPVGACSQLIGLCVNETNWVMYNVLKVIDDLPLSNIQGLPLYTWQIVLSFSGILLFVFSLRNRNKWVFMLSMGTFSVVLISALIVRMELKSFTGLKVYNTGRELSLAWMEKGNVHVFSTVESIADKNIKFSMLSDLKKHGVAKDFRFTQLSAQGANPYLEFNGDVRLFVMNGKTDNYPQSELLIIRNNSALPEKVLAAITLFDGSNSWKHIQESIGVLEAENRSYYVLKDNFAYVWDSDHIWKKPVYPF